MILEGTPLNLTQAARLVSQKYLGGREVVHASAIYRWARSGIKAATGERIRLEYLKVGRRWRTDEAAISRFFAAVAEAEQRAQAAVDAADTPARRPKATNPAKRQAAVDDATRKVLAA